MRGGHPSLPRPPQRQQRTGQDTHEVHGERGQSAPFHPASGAVAAARLAPDADIQAGAILAGGPGRLSETGAHARSLDGQTIANHRALNLGTELKATQPNHGLGSPLSPFSACDSHPSFEEWASSLARVSLDAAGVVGLGVQAPGVVAIIVVNGHEVLVDAQDADFARSFYLGIGKTPSSIAVNAQDKIDGKKRRLSRRLTGAASDQMVDHINGNPLDNRRENLRVCTPRDNATNTAKRANCSSVYKGVSWIKRERHWRARIALEGKEVVLGYFQCEISAAQAYDAAARLHFGNAATFNFPLEGEQAAGRPKSASYLLPHDGGNSCG